MTKAQIISAQQILSDTQNRVFLINPPVIDSRYEWIKWNQPLDLLKLSTMLKTINGCQVKLFDFMLPNPSGIVPRRQSRLEFDLPSEEQARWHFGQSWEKFDEYLDSLLDIKWIPNSVWITTLTSFWWQAVPLVADRVKNKLQCPPIILYGNYPSLETKHAAQFCFNVDTVIKDKINLNAWSSDFSLYENHKPKFRALDMYGRDPIGEISESLKNGISHFAFFNENLFSNFDTNLKPILEDVVKQDWNIQFHGICGIEAKDFPIDHIALLTKANFNELHIEPIYSDDGTVDEPKYREILKACEQAGLVRKRGAGWESRRHYLSGFLWVGYSNDDIEMLVWNALMILQLVGMVILKPFTPTPGTKEYKFLKSKLDYIEPEDISPHRIPFAEINGLSKSDYTDLYRMAAFLNRKVRGRTFDYLGKTYLKKVIKDSLSARNWDIP